MRTAGSRDGSGKERWLTMGWLSRCEDALPGHAGGAARPPMPDPPQGSAALGPRPQSEEECQIGTNSPADCHVIVTGSVFGL